MKVTAGGLIVAIVILVALLPSHDRTQDKTNEGTSELHVNPIRVDTHYANSGYFQTIIDLPSYTQRMREMKRYYALLQRQNRGVGQRFDPNLIRVLKIEDQEMRQSAFEHWDRSPKPDLDMSTDMSTYS